MIILQEEDDYVDILPEELAKKKQVKKPTDKSVKTVKDRKAKRGGDGPRGGASIPKHQVAMKR